MEYSIDKSNIIITSDEYPYGILSYFSRDGGKFESHSFWQSYNKVKEIQNKLCDVIVNQHLLSFEKNPKTGDIVEIECDGDSNNVIRWLRWKDDWYISDINEEIPSD